MSTSSEPESAAFERSESSNQPTTSFFEDPLNLRTILVPTDFSDASFRALDFALPLAKRFGASVHVIYVYEGKPRFSSLVDTPELFLDPAIELFDDREISGRLRGEVQRRFAVDLPETSCHFRSGRSFPEICDVARNLSADLIVMASHGHSGLKHFTVGSTAEKVVHHAGCPVLVIRAGTREPLRTVAEGIVLEKILVPVDFSDCAKEGARYASVFAARVSADLLLMHVVHPSDYMAAEGMPIGPDWSQLVETTRADAEEKLDELVNFLPLSGIDAETEVAVGTPADVLADASARPGIAMVITSTHGHSGLRHALLGSVAETLVRTAKCPVLVVPSHLPAAAAVTNTHRDLRRSESGNLSAS